MKIQTGSQNSRQSNSVALHMYENQEPFFATKNGQFWFSPELVKQKAKSDNGTDGLMEIAMKVKNSNDYLQPVGVFEKLLQNIVEPYKVPFGFEYKYDNKLSKTEIQIENVIKPHTNMSIQGLMEKFKAPTLDYSNGNLPIQTGTNPNVYHPENTQPEFGDMNYVETPVLSYASNYKYTLNEANLMKAHNIWGDVINFDIKYQKFLDRFEEQYVYDMVNTNDVLLKERTLLDQEGETAINDLGIPNNVYGLSDTTLTMNELQDILFKIATIINNKNNSVQGMRTPINTFIIPLSDANLLTNNKAIEDGSALTNLRFQSNTIHNRMEYVVSFFQSLSTPVRVIACNQFNPSSQSSGVYDSAIANTMNPASAIQVKNRNTIDRPFYLLTNDNSGREQEILFAPKINYFSSGFVNEDPLGQVQITGKIDLFSGIKYIRPAVSRALITTNNS